MDEKNINYHKDFGKEVKSVINKFRFVKTQESIKIAKTQIKLRKITLGSLESIAIVKGNYEIVFLLDNY